MQRTLSNLLVQAAQALCVVLGAPPFTRSAPLPAVVLVTAHSRTSHERAALYQRRYSRYLAAVGDVHR